MVSIRCKMAVRAALDNQKILYRTIELGEADTIDDVTEAQRGELRRDLLKSGLELMDDKKAMLIEKVKNVVVEMIHYSDEPIKVNFSNYLSEKLQQDYAYLSTLFSDVTGTTIEHYIIAHKIEKVKELLLYDELNLTEISYQLNYSSVAHLSNQFKKVTGLSPSYFKNLKQHRQRIALEDL
jgi:AraC-like DNA-binding protein